MSKERRWDVRDVTLGVLGLAYVGWVVAVGLFIVGYGGGGLVVPFAERKTHRCVDCTEQDAAWHGVRSAAASMGAPAARTYAMAMAFGEIQVWGAFTDLPDAEIVRRIRDCLREYRRAVAEINAA